MSTTTSVNSKKVYYKELVCMNCGYIHEYEVPFGVEWSKHVVCCDKCGCCRFSDYYKNIDNFRPAPKYGYDRGPWMGLTKEELDQILERNRLLCEIEKHMPLDCRGVNVEPTPTERITTYMETKKMQDFADSLPETDLQEIINTGGYAH